MKITLAYLDEPPFCMPQPGGPPTGCDVELARLVLGGAGITDVEMRLATFAELIPGLVDGRWHMTTGLFVTDERARHVDFSRPVWALSDGLMVRAGNPLSLDGYEAIARHAGARLAVVADQVQHQTARRSGVPEDRIVVFATQDEAARAVSRGEADAYASVAMAHRGYLARSGTDDLALVAIAPHLAGGSGAAGAFAFSRQCSALRASVDKEIQRILGTPEHRRMMTRFGFSDAEIDPVMSSVPRAIGQRPLYQGWTRLLEVELDLGAGGTARREVEDHGDAAAVLPYDPERRVACLVELLRAPLLYRRGLKLHLEAPAGLIEVGETAEANVRREAQEEVGLALASLEPVGRAFSTPGLSTEAIHLFLAPYGERDRIGAGGGVASEHENIRVREIALTELWTMLERGELTDMKTLVLLHALRHRRPDLFD